MARRGRPALSEEPLYLSRRKAAAFVGVSAAKFDKLVERGEMPPPRLLIEQRMWDRALIVAYARSIAFDPKAPPPRYLEALSVDAAAAPRSHADEALRWRAEA